MLDSKHTPLLILGFHIASVLMLILILHAGTMW
jgi:hypothetical protein